MHTSTDTENGTHNAQTQIVNLLKRMKAHIHTYCTYYIYIYIYMLLCKDKSISVNPEFVECHILISDKSLDTTKEVIKIKLMRREKT